MRNELNSMGYSDIKDAETIEWLIKQADAAYEAATKVRTLAQLWSVLKESVGSGWAESFEYIFGDLNKATDLFTNLKDIFDGFLNKLTDRRNKNLKWWTYFGGDRMLHLGLENTAKVLVKIGEAIDKAVRKLFGLEIMDMVRFSESFQNGSEKFLAWLGDINDATSNVSKLASILETVYYYLRLVMWIKHPFRSLFIELMQMESFRSMFVGLFDVVFDVVGSISRIINDIVKGENPFTHLKDYFNQSTLDTITNFAKKIPVFFTNLKNNIVEALSSSDIVANIKEYFSSIITSIRQGISDLIDSVVNMFSGSSSSGKKLSKGGGITGAIDEVIFGSSGSSGSGSSGSRRSEKQGLADEYKALIEEKDIIGKITDVARNRFGSIFQIIDTIMNASQEEAETDTLDAITDVVRNRFGSIFETIDMIKNASQEELDAYLYETGNLFGSKLSTGINSFTRGFTKSFSPTSLLFGDNEALNNIAMGINEIGEAVAKGIKRVFGLETKKVTGFHYVLMDEEERNAAILADAATKNAVSLSDAFTEGTRTFLAWLGDIDDSTSNVSKLSSIIETIGYGLRLIAAIKHPFRAIILGLLSIDSLRNSLPDLLNGIFEIISGISRVINDVINGGNPFLHLADFFDIESIKGIVDFGKKIPLFFKNLAVDIIEAIKSSDLLSDIGDFFGSLFDTIVGAITGKNRKGLVDTVVDEVIFGSSGSGGGGSPIKRQEPVFSMEAMKEKYDELLAIAEKTATGTIEEAKQTWYQKGIDLGKKFFEGVKSFFVGFYDSFNVVKEQLFKDAGVLLDLGQSAAWVYTIFKGGKLIGAISDMTDLMTVSAGGGSIFKKLSYAFTKWRRGRNMLTDDEKEEDATTTVMNIKKKVDTIGTLVLKLTASFGILVGALYVLSKMTSDDYVVGIKRMLQMIASMTLIILVVGGLSRAILATKLSQRSPANELLKLTAVLAALALTIKIVSGITDGNFELGMSRLWSMVGLVTALTAIVGVFGVFSRISKKSSMSIGTQVIALAVSIWILYRTFKSIANFLKDYDGKETYLWSAASFITTMIIVLGTFAGIMTTLGNIGGKGGKNTWKSVAAIAASVYLITESFKMITELIDGTSPDVLEQAKIIMAIIGGFMAIAIIFTTIDSIKSVHSASTMAKIVLIGIMFGAVIGVVGYVINSMRDVPEPTIKSFGKSFHAIVMSLTVGIWALSKVGLGGALNAVAALTVIGAAIGALGYLVQKFPSMNSVLIDGAEMVGEFFGALLGGALGQFTESMSSHLPGVGTNVSTFFANLDISSVSTVAGYKQDFETVLGMLKNISTWYITGGRNLRSVNLTGLAITGLFEAFKTESGEKLIDSSMLSNVGDANTFMEQLDEALKKATTLSGANPDINMEQLKTNMMAVASIIAMMANTITDYELTHEDLTVDTTSEWYDQNRRDQELIQRVVKLMNGILDEIPNLHYPKQGDFEKFGEVADDLGIGMVIIGTALAGFSTITKDVKYDPTTGPWAALGMFTDMIDSIGLISRATSKLTVHGNSFKNIDTSSMSEVEALLFTLADSASSSSDVVYEQSDVVNNFNELALGIEAIGKAISKFKTGGENYIDPDDINFITNSIIPAINAFISAENDITKDSVSTSNISSFGSRLKAFTEATKDITFPENISSQQCDDLITTIGSFERIENDLAERDGLWQKIAGQKDIGEFGVRLQKLADALKEIDPATFNKFGSIESGTMDNVKGIVEVFSSMESMLDNHGGWIQSVVGDQTLADFGVALTTFATGLRDSVIAITEIDADKGEDGLTKLESAINSYKEKVTELVTWVNGEDSIFSDNRSVWDKIIGTDTNVDQMERFGIAIGSIADAMTKISSISGDSNASLETFVSMLTGVATGNTNELTWFEVTKFVNNLGGALLSIDDLMNNYILLNEEFTAAVPEGSPWEKFAQYAVQLKEKMNKFIVDNMAQGIDIENPDNSAYKEQLTNYLVELFGSVTKAVEGMSDEQVNIAGIEEAFRTRLSALNLGSILETSIETSIDGQQIIAAIQTGFDEVETTYGQALSLRVESIGESIALDVIGGFKGKISALSEEMVKEAKEIEDNGLDMSSYTSLSEMYKYFTELARSSEPFAKLEGSNTASYFMDGFASGIVDDGRMTSALSDLLNALPDNMFATIFNSGSNIGSQIDGEIAAGLEQSYTMASTLKGIISGLKKDVFSTAADSGRYLGRMIALGVASGIKGSVGLVTAAATAIANAASTAFAAAVKIKSPSRVFAKYGYYIDAGLANGILDSTRVVTNAVESMSDELISGAEYAYNIINDTINSGMDINPTITPVMDLSDLTDKANSIDSFFGNNYSLAMSAALAGSIGGRSIIGGQTNGVDIGSILDRIDDLTDKMTNLQVMLDGNALVGGIIGRVDQKLNERAQYSRRAR